ncbi:MAG: amidohydrolase family protein, partial [Chloroflexota bacterium]
MNDQSIPYPPARLVLLNGRIYTQDAARPVVQAIASVGNRIVAAGSHEDALAAAGPDAQIIDLGGRAVVPGFIDAHFHFLGYSFDRQRVHLDQATSIAEVQRLIAPLAGTDSAGETDAWVLGRGWDRNLWPDTAFPTRHDLDAVTGARPAALLSRDVHAVGANTR